MLPSGWPPLSASESRTLRSRLSPRTKAERDQKSRDPATYLVRKAKARAKAAGIPFDLRPEDIAVPARCPILGIPLKHASRKPSDNSPSLDRIIPDLGYVKGNVAVVSMRANRIKSDGSLQEHLAVAQYLAKRLARH